MLQACSLPTAWQAAGAAFQQIVSASSLAPLEQQLLGRCHTSVDVTLQRSQAVCSSLSAALGWAGEEWSTQWKLSGVT